MPKQSLAEPRVNPVKSQGKGIPGRDQYVQNIELIILRESWDRNSGSNKTNKQELQ